MPSQRTSTAAPGTGGDRHSSWPAAIALTLLVLGTAGYFLWYEPARQADDGAAGASVTDGALTEASPTSTPDPAAVVDPAAATTAAPPGGAAVSGSVGTAPLAGAPPEPSATEAPRAGQPTRADYAAAIGSIGDASFPITGDSWPCVGGLVVDQLGGAAALNTQGLGPADFTERQTDGRLQVPDGARQRIAGGFGSCQIDTIALLLAQLEAGTPADARECIRTGLDRTTADEALVAQLLGGADALDAVSALYVHFTEVGERCYPGGG